MALLTICKTSQKPGNEHHGVIDTEAEHQSAQCYSNVADDHNRLTSFAVGYHAPEVAAKKQSSSISGKGSLVTPKPHLLDVWETVGL